MSILPIFSDFRPFYRIYGFLAKFGVFHQKRAIIGGVFLTFNIR